LGKQNPKPKRNGNRSAGSGEKLSKSSIIRGVTRGKDESNITEKKNTNPSEKPENADIIRKN